jgi:hypothetical protein
MSMPVYRPVFEKTHAELVATCGMKENPGAVIYAN